MNHVILVGPPNAGKTSLFNWITGSNFKTVNYPGATVNYFEGSPLSQYNTDFKVIDTPGVYSLFPKSQDEMITHNILNNDNPNIHVQKAIVVVDATQFERHMGLFEQLKSVKIPVVLAITMMDILKESGQSIDTQALSESLGVPVVPIDGLLGGGVSQLMETVQRLEIKEKQIEALKSSKSKKSHPLNQLKRWEKKDFENSLNNLFHLKNKTFIEVKTRKNWHHLKLTESLDRVLLHPFFGLVFFFLVMSGLFTSVYSLATPLIDLIDGWFGTMSTWVLSVGGGSLFSQFLADGIIAGFGSFFVFIPQVAILFLGLILLEDTGYLARATTLVDKPLSKIGLNGRSFVPLLSGYACAVPASMAARTITNKRERWLTLFALPLMTCSARLPVYALLFAFFFVGQPAWYGGVALALVYFLSLFFGALFALLLKNFLPQDEQSLFALELPLYRRPRIMPVLSQVLAKTKYFVKKAGPIIFTLSVLIWAGSVFPNYDMEDDVKRLQTSYISQMGQYLEPVFEPMGVDWRVGVGLLSAFAAREVFVSALAVVFNVTEETTLDGGDSEESIATTLLEKMRTAKLSNGQLIFTTATIIGLILFFMIALQCIATVGVIYQETESVRFVMFQLFAFNLIAYALAVLVQQVSHLI